MEAGNALEPVVVRAMERAGWQVDPADPQDPNQVAVRIGPNVIVTGHPRRLGAGCQWNGGEAVSELATVQMLLFGDEPAAPPYGGPMVVEIKNARPRGVQAMADPRRGAQPPGVGGPSRLLHPRRVRADE